MHVLFVEPAFPTNQQKFIHALADVGAQVTAIGEAPEEMLGSELRSRMVGYEQISSVVNEEALADAVTRIQRRGWVDRLEATVEAHVMATAKVRERCGIPGTSVQTTFLCRDKPAMKEFLRKHGIPCALSTGADSPQEVRDFAAEVGFPLILKPRDAAGAAGTFRADDGPGLEQAIVECGVDRGHSVAVEEFIEGHEGFYDTLTIGGEISHEFITHYYPNVLDAMRHRDVSPVFITTNRLDASGYNDVKEMGAKVIDALGLETAATHMEWFVGPKGLKFSEIGCRPPGVGAWDLYCEAHEMDVYQEWAAAITHGKKTQRRSRRFSAGIVNLRPNQDGTIVGYEGIEEMNGALGEWIIDYRFPSVGSRTQPVEAGYMANAWVRVKHPDYDQLREMLGVIGRNVRILAE